MSVLFLLLPLGLLLSGSATVAFIWAVRRGQFDDTQTPAVRILSDDAGGALKTDRRAIPSMNELAPRQRRQPSDG